MSTPLGTAPGARLAFDPEATLAALASGPRADRLRHVHEVPARPASLAEWPQWVDPSVYAACAGAGVTSLWSHQREAADLAHSGSHVVMATGTASGKSLGYLLPVLTALVEGSAAPTGRGATALYLSPTKALAADQLSRVQAMAAPGVRAATYDGDTPSEERRWIRDHAHLVLTNPDLVHHSLLPLHERWAPFLRRLRYVVIDECHVYRGVFGSHLAALLRRLRRVCARYGASPTFVLASATVRDPGDHASRLVGLPVTAVTTDGSPREAMTFALWEPGPLDEGFGATAPTDLGWSGGRPADEVPSGPQDEFFGQSFSAAELTDTSGETPARRSATSEAADLLAQLVAAKVQTVAFARSRAGVEALASSARRTLEGQPRLAAAVAAYRGGYLPEERRELERAVRHGDILGLAATNALELGVDISGLDAVLLAGWPGTRASLWQQAGRAGRAGTRSLAVFVAADDPLDTYVVNHPEVVFGQPVESTVLDPDNPHVLAPHLAAAAAELPLREADLEMFGPDARRLVDALVARGILRRRPTGWFWARSDRASDHVSLRGSGEVVGIVERRTGRVLGTIDEASAHSQVHTGAVHVHQGSTYVVTELDLEAGTATAVRGDPGWSTFAQSVSAFDVVGASDEFSWGPIDVAFGNVRVHHQVTSFLRRLPGGEVIGTHPLTLPQRTLATKAVWWTMPVDWLEAVGVAEVDIPGAAHAAEHAAIGMMPLVATSDRWDIGGVSTALHPDTGLPTIMVYDGHPGGAGFAQRAFGVFEMWLSATLEAVRSCRCESGCPGCVQSPKCGNGNEPLDKAGAVRLLEAVLRHAPEPA
ncbi:DEAD/DEAH box helicase [Phycicoccus sp. Root101]|uniref:DEAD/DEAH box helicase n=1 Tax=Phycicoccus sp. Root101 TaxID=1736421 RepID=UPI0007024696|nr:DEAD/DEAH box helicase [Phycicoccus sp. Root101]KQU65396.1 helicase [Phycicoccus sp. Root101]